MTLRVHVICHYFDDYSELSGETLFNKTTELTESTHNIICIHKKVHSYRVVNCLGTDHHVQKSFNSVVHWNSKNISSPNSLVCILYLFI